MAEKIRRKVKRNNNGSTMVIVLIMLSFIMILATVVTSSTIMQTSSQLRLSIHLRMLSMKCMLRWDRCQQTALIRHIRMR